MYYLYVGKTHASFFQIYFDKLEENRIGDRCKGDKFWPKKGGEASHWRQDGGAWICKKKKN